MKYYFVFVLYLLHCGKSVVATYYETPYSTDNNYEDDTKSNQMSYSPGSNANPETQLITVQMIWRHGQRTQLKTFPTDRFSPLVYNGYGVKGFGQLTERGALQSYELGKYIRKRYNNGFIGPKYATNEIYLLGGDFDRSIMSGIAVCQSLYPKFVQDSESDYNYGWGQDNGYESVWFPVPLRTVPIEDSFIAQSADCTAYNILYAQYLNSSKINTPDVMKLYQYLTKYSGTTIQNFQDTYYLYDYYDAIFNQQSHDYGLPVPRWAYEVKNEMYQIYTIFYYGFVDSFEMMRFESGTLLYRLFLNFECQIGIGPANCTKVKIYAFSGFINTVTPLLFLFDKLDKNFQLTDASLLLFELHKKGNEYYVAIYYRPNGSPDYDDIRELLLDVCGGLRCTYSQFKMAYKRYSVSDDEWNFLCNQNL